MATLPAVSNVPSNNETKEFVFSKDVTQALANALATDSLANMPLDQANDLTGKATWAMLREEGKGASRVGMSQQALAANTLSMLHARIQREKAGVPKLVNSNELASTAANWFGRLEEEREIEATEVGRGKENKVAIIARTLLPKFRNGINWDENNPNAEEAEDNALVEFIAEVDRQRARLKKPIQFALLLHSLGYTAHDFEVNVGWHIRKRDLVHVIRKGKKPVKIKVQREEYTDERGTVRTRDPLDETIVLAAKEGGRRGFIVYYKTKDGNEGFEVVPATVAQMEKAWKGEPTTQAENNGINLTKSFDHITARIWRDAMTPTDIEKMLAMAANVILYCERHNLSEKMGTFMKGATEQADRIMEETRRRNESKDDGEKSDTQINPSLDPANAQKAGKAALDKMNEERLAKARKLREDADAAERQQQRTGTDG